MKPASAVSRLLLVTPADWWRIPLQDGVARARSVRALVRRQFRGVDDQPALRSQTEGHLAEAAQAAAERDGLEMYVATDTVVGVPIAASLVVSLLPAPIAGRSVLGRLAQELRTDGSEVALIDLPIGAALRRRRTERIEEASRMGATDDSVLVDFYLPAPRDACMVLLNFATPLLPLAQPMAELFEAVASTARWEGSS
jgi:hypothetical protein